MRNGKSASGFSCSDEWVNAYLPQNSTSLAENFGSSIGVRPAKTRFVFFFDFGYEPVMEENRKKKLTGFWTSSGCEFMATLFKTPQRRVGISVEGLKCSKSKLNFPEQKVFRIPVGSALRVRLCLFFCAIRPEKKVDRVPVGTMTGIREPEARPAKSHRACALFAAKAGSLNHPNPWCHF